MEVSGYLSVSLLLIFSHITDVGGDQNTKENEDGEKQHQRYGRPHIRRFQFNVLLRPYKEECFYQDAVLGLRLVIFYQVMNDEGNVQFRHINPDEAEDHIELENRGHRSIESNKEGVHSYCFTNFKRKEIQLHVIWTLIDQNLQRTLYEQSKAVPEEYQGTWNATIGLLNEVDAMYKYLIQKRRRAYNDRQLVESNGDFVAYWSMAQCFVIILTGITEVFILRTMFRTVSHTPTNKPRS